MRVPQQPQAQRRSGQRGHPEAGTPKCHQVRVAQEAGRFCQDLAQSLVCSARGSALLLQRRGGDQSPGKTADMLERCCRWISQIVHKILQKITLLNTRNDEKQMKIACFFPVCANQCESSSQLIMFAEET